jgi:uncharacterized membrane protein YidH (DUF202 family)
LTGPVPEDGGRQFERTAFAWLRTALALTAVALLLVREAGQGDDARWAGFVAVGALVIGLAVSVFRSEVLDLRSPGVEAPSWLMQTLVGVVLGLQLASLIVVL